MAELAPSIVRVGIEAADRDAAIEMLVRELHGLGQVTDAGNAIASVIDREEIQSTAIGGGIAFPHARTPAAPDLVYAAARLNRAIDFRAPDESPVDLVFLLLGPPDNPDDHVRLLARLARMLRRDEVLASLREVADERAFRAILERQSDG